MASHPAFTASVILGVAQEWTPEKENLMPIRYGTVKVDHVVDDGAGDREVREFSQQHALVFDDERLLRTD
jgi:hypothetical protein